MSLINIVAIVAVLVVLTYLVVLFNSLTKKKNLIENSVSDIDVQLKRRYDLVPNLIETVKGSASFEKETLEKVVLARNSAMNISTKDNLEAKLVADNMMTGALKSIFALSESYPDLKSSTNFSTLQSQLSEIEDSVQSARRYMNAAVREYNDYLLVFPANLLSKLFGFVKSEYHLTSESEKENIKVSF